MEKRALLAVVLSIVVLGIWQVMVAPPSSPPPGEEAPVQSGGTPPAPGPEAPGEAAVAGAPEEAPAAGAATTENSDAVLPPPAEAVAGTEQREFVVETASASVRFDNQGGRIVWWRLLKYTDDSGAPLNLIPGEIPEGTEYPFRLAVPGDQAATAALDKAIWLADDLEASSLDEWPGDGFRGRIISFTWADGRGLEAVKRLALPEDGYVGRVMAEVRRDGRILPLQLTWAVGLPEPEDGGTLQYWNVEGQGVIYVKGEAVRFPAAKTTEVREVSAARDGDIQWAGMESTYFTSLILPGDVKTAAFSFAPVITAQGLEEDDEPEQLLAARFESAGAVDVMNFVGPKDYELLTNLGRGLEEAIHFSRFALLSALSKYLFLGLKWIHGYVGNYGVAIILLTIVLRVGFFPLMYRSSITMRQNAKKMQRIQPRVKAIQERYKKMKRTVESQRKMNDEIMNVYKKEGMNPMGTLGGCLPLLIQMPFFLAFYNLLSVTIEMRGAPFMLWLTDLSRMDPYYVLPILMGISWLVQQSMTSSSIPDPMQRRIMGLMPLMFTFMMRNMPSGLVLYWFISNLLGLGQQWIINRQADKEPASA